jgi:hypothetical protein
MYKLFSDVATHAKNVVLFASKQRVSVDIVVMMAPESTFKCHLLMVDKTPRNPYLNKAY